jgi:peptide/nickel transport system substrate-binding protein
MTPILPPQTWEQYATGDGKGLRSFPNEPEGGQPLVGGGPFVLTEYRKNDIALFEKNPNWYGTPAHVDGFGLQFFRDEDAMITALKTDQLDAINEIPPTSVATLKSAGMEVYQGEALALRDLIFNLDPSKTENRELLDPKVRGDEYAIDREACRFASPGSTIIPRGTPPGVRADPASSAPYDPAMANSILDSPGYADGRHPHRRRPPDEYEQVFHWTRRGPRPRVPIMQQGSRSGSV